jgi:hypothetical protein
VTGLDSGQVIRWRVLLGLHDCVCGCPACRAALFYDPEQPGQCCWNCSAPLPVPVTLKLQGSLLVLSEGAMLASHHLNRDRDYRKGLRGGRAGPPPAGPFGAAQPHRQDLDGDP